MSIVLFAVLTYLFTSIPYGYLVAKIKHIDITKIGSRNIGATNVYRALGMKSGITVLLLDFFKGLIPVLIIQRILPGDFYVIIIGLAAVLGHIFSVFMKFKGGKGVATSAGVLAGIMGLVPVLIFIGIWILLLKTIRIMSVVNLILMPVITIYLFLTHSWWFGVFGLTITIFVFWSHRKNIQNLRKGEEKKLF